MNSHVYSARDRPSTQICNRTGATVAAAFWELLAANERASGLGTPLLTTAGVWVVLGLLAVGAGQRTASAPSPASNGVVGLPHWDPDGRQLWLGDRLLK